MPLTNAKHIITEIDGIRCSVAEANAPLERAAFIRMLLEFNGYEVKEIEVPAKEEGVEKRYTVAVTDILFNPVFAVYERRLRTPEGDFVTPGYWNQECTECDPMYWQRKRR